MYDLKEGSAQGRMPGAGSVVHHYPVQVQIASQSEFLGHRSNAQGTCEGCVNFMLTGSPHGPAGNCGTVCPGLNRILVRR